DDRVDLGDAGSEPGEPGPQAGAEAVFLLDGLARMLHLGRVLRGQLYVRAGCGVAPSDHPGHELYSKATSFALVAAVVGPMFILPNVGLNEWGHAFWFVDELFSAPLHWGFVTLGWCGLFASAGGVAAQIISRMSNLADVIWNNAPKSILDPFSSQLSGGAKSGGY